MRNLQIIVITVFLLVAVAFTSFFCYDRLMNDHTAPVIVCDGVPLYVSITATDKELCAGLTATDDVDGDITDRIVVRKVSQLVGSNSALIYYAVFDSSSNYCTFSRSVQYTDYCKPRFALSKPLSYNVSSTVFLQDRLTAYDTLDGDISSRIRLSSNSINNTVPGDYPITIQVTNRTGDTAVATLTVRIENTDTRQPIINLTDYLIYAELGEELTEDTLRSYINNVKQSYAGGEIDINEVSILSDVDTSTRGSYNVTYTYTNAAGYNASVLMTVIVE